MPFIFYELLIILEESSSLNLKIKHFNPDLTGWEEKDEVVSFPLVKLTPDAAYFDGLTFRQLEDDILQVILEVEDGDKVVDLEFLHHRVTARDRH